MKYLIWSNQHRLWWRHDEKGYTQYIEEAGRYSYDDAKRIINVATAHGRLAFTRVNPITGETYTYFDEYMVIAPEDTPSNETP
jgi:hypothetical protein